MSFYKSMEQALEFSGKKVFIAPYTPKTTMFAQELQEQHEFEFLGYLDSFQTGSYVTKPSEVTREYDAVLILSQNHGDAIYESLQKTLQKNKLVKVISTNSGYHFLTQTEADASLKSYKSTKQKQSFLHLLAKVYDRLSFNRTKLVFVAKGSITSNNKALYIHCIREKLDVVMLTDNKEQLQTLQKMQLPVVELTSYKAYTLLAQAKFVIQDQANITEEINLLSPQQKTLQMWHGIPLKRLNKLTTVSYDYLISTSNFVNETTLSKVIKAKEYKDFGYPRNDLLLKEEHDAYDLLFCDDKMYKLAKDNFEKNHKIILYMPTHRESKKATQIPLDFVSLNKFLADKSMTLILKLHHFVEKLYSNEKNYSNILFHSTHGDVYPLLKYTDILITDYSSVYFDFMLLERPIIFFDYDREEYEANMQGFLYDYEEFTPGMHVKNQHTLQNALLNPTTAGFLHLKSLLFTYQKDESSSKIMEYLK
ncbi:MAG: CDP-glycerol glycerophosphotransferase family protein [Campylobacterales bacterium]|nr:CDP-glycerol glycerophosphotransferase family protein [Campylobacterales bacterium]